MNTAHQITHCDHTTSDQEDRGILELSKQLAESARNLISSTLDVATLELRYSAFLLLVVAGLLFIAATGIVASWGLLMALFTSLLVSAGLSLTAALGTLTALNVGAVIGAVLYAKRLVSKIGLSETRKVTGFYHRHAYH